MIIAAIDAPNMFLDNARLLEQLIPNVELVELTGCDHWAQYERADEFNRLAGQFLAHHERRTMATFDQQTCTTLAQELHEAEQRREQVRHLSLRYPNMSIEDGYAVSRAWAQIKTAKGNASSGTRSA